MRPIVVGHLAGRAGGLADGQRRRQLVEEMLGLSLYYMPFFEQALEKEGVPLELKYLPVIESALNPDAVSRVGATGLWQFMLTTAKGLGLEVNSIIDERRDPIRSSEMAAKYLKQLYNIYGDWSLAIASYNCGPGNVNKALRRAGGTADKKKDYATAVAYGEKLFSTPDTVKFTANDYIFYGDALTNVGRFDDAVAAYNKLPEVDPENKDVKKYIADTYTKAKRFTDAVAAMEAYIAAKGEGVTYKEYDALADIYIDEASVEGAANDAKVKAFENADKVYAQIETKFDYAAAYAVWKRALMHYQINPDVKVGRALPFYKKYIDIVSAKAEKTASETSKLATAYTYLAVHYIQNDKKEEAKEWATKLLEIKPDDPNGLQIMSIK